jgi:hypothetical protein
LRLRRLLRRRPAGGDEKAGRHEESLHGGTVYKETANGRRHINRQTATGNRQALFSARLDSGGDLLDLVHHA